MFDKIVNFDFSPTKNIGDQRAEITKWYEISERKLILKQLNLGICGILHELDGDE